MLTVLDGRGAATPRITSLLIKPVSAVCNLDCAYCFYLDRETDPYKSGPVYRMDTDTLERLVDTYLFYSHPESTFTFQGGEPMLAGLGFFEKLIDFQKRHGRAGQSVSNALQTNGVLIDENWCRLFKEYNWLVGVSLDGPEDVHNAYRLDKRGEGSWSDVIRGIETLKKHGVEFNVLCTLHHANVEKPRDLYRFFRSLGVEHIQYIPIAEFDGLGSPLPYSITPEQYGRFLCETFDAWWAERRQVRIRNFDNIAEALAGRVPGNCTMHTTCDSYVVVEHNGDVYPCDFFVESGWKLGNIVVDSWPEIARRQSRATFAAKKTLPRPECMACEYETLCHGGCPKLRRAPNRRFEDLDYFCLAYKMVFARVTGPLRRELDRFYSGRLPSSPGSTSSRQR